MDINIVKRVDVSMTEYEAEVIYLALCAYKNDDDFPDKKREVAAYLREKISEVVSM